MRIIGWLMKICVIGSLVGVGWGVLAHLYNTRDEIITFLSQLPAPWLLALLSFILLNVVMVGFALFALLSHYFSSDAWDYTD